MLREWLAPRVSWNAVLVSQKLRSPFGDAWFSHFPLLGNEIMYIIATPALVWFVDMGAARRFCFMAFVACLVCNSMKDILRLPRPPPKLHVRGKNEQVAQQFGFPSGHSAINLAISMQLALEAVSNGVATPFVAYTLALAHTLHVCFSRFYMGVHSLADVMGGLSIGALSIGMLLTCGYFVDAASVQSPAGQAAALAMSLVALSLYPDKRDTNSAFTEVVQFGGLHIGACLAGSHPTWPSAQPNTRGLTIALQYIVGLISLGVVRTICSSLAKMLIALLPEGRCKAAGVIARKYIVSAIAGIWVFALHPATLLAAVGHAEN